MKNRVLIRVLAVAAFLAITFTLRAGDAPDLNTMSDEIRHLRDELQQVRSGQPAPPSGEVLHAVDTSVRRSWEPAYANCSTCAGGHTTP